MYHDQVLTPMKTLYEYDAVNITLGLPFLRITPDHGPNTSMLGKNLSDPKNGEFTFFTAVCYGSSGNDCIYVNTYLRSYDYGDTWKIGFLE